MSLITEDWLKENGFRLVSERNDERTKPDIRLRRLAIKQYCTIGRTIFDSPDDLCIDIAFNPASNNWYVWLHQEDPYRFIHIRNFRDRVDLISFFEVLTGSKFEEVGNQNDND